MTTETHSEDRIKFLGTAGARYVMARQLRYSAGTYLELKGRKMILDPGPGTLLRCARVKPPIDVTGLDAVVLSHAHIDHSGDINAIVDAMTSGGWEKRGSLFMPSDCLQGENRILLNYIKNAPERVETLEAESEYNLNGLKFFTSPPLCHDVETYGLKFETAGGMLGFVIDTLYFDGLVDIYSGCRWLVINVVRLKEYTGHRKLKHLSLIEAEDLIAGVKPECAVLTHFGMTVVNNKPWEIAVEMSERLGIDVRAANDGMELVLADS